MNLDYSDHPTAITPDDRARLTTCQHHDPHGIYGWHPVDGGSVIRTRQLGATSVELLLGDQAIGMEPLGDDIFAVQIQDTVAPDYRLRVHYPEADKVIDDPYRFLPTLTEFDLYLIGEGRHERLWEVLGANVRSYETENGAVTGTSFAVWAPNAKGVAVVGDFCAWNPNQFPMRSLGSAGVWEIFIPSIEPGTEYKFAVQSPAGHRKDHADPLAKATKAPPETVSVVAAPSEFAWSDEDWLSSRVDTSDKPMSVYECHIGSWKVGMGYRQLADELTPYLVKNGFTHVEFLPVAEHPFGGSWGYQVTGYYAPTARWGTPDDLRYLIDTLHANGIGVIVDWVPAHFPKDDWALARFDGTPCYEHPDWRRGEQKDWGTYVFNFGRNEVRNFLVANALYWAEEFHIDGLRVDAVASMLYLDYSRNDGEWLPNPDGSRENWDAVHFLQEFNATVHRNNPGFLTIAEESTAWPGVTAMTDGGGLGFTLKWNMGWMNDTLQYFKYDPAFRSYHHGEITFSMVYAYSEHYVLPFSHDEVVHGKGSLWGRMPGDDWHKAAGLRALYAYMYSHPGKKLMFMGQEFGQTGEWAEAYSIDWSNLEGWGHEYHEGIADLVASLNTLYREEPALYSKDFDPSGFQWIKGDDATHNVLSYVRIGDDGEKILALCNFSGLTYHNFHVGVPGCERAELILNTDSPIFAGGGNDIAEEVTPENIGWDGQSHRLTVKSPALSVQWYKLH